MRKTREERRAEIAAAALKIVGEFGVQGTTMARIADAVGISGPALYKHFAGRTEILEAAMDLLPVRAVSWPDSSKNPNALERLRELGTRHALTIAAEEGQAHGPIRKDIDMQVVARSLMGLTWIENLAALEGMEEFVTDGVSKRMLDRILAEIAAPGGLPAPVATMTAT